MYIRQIFLIEMEYRLQSMYNHMFVSSFYSILLGMSIFLELLQCTELLTKNEIVKTTFCLKTPSVTAFLMIFQRKKEVYSCREF